MKKPSKTAAPVGSNATEWIRWLWEVEAEHSPMIGSRLKFGLPLSPAKPKRRKVKAARRAAVKV
ncbi:MAG: hypothetical protein ACKVY0_12620 [Prosthecobacter sp.]|uniref:hypothetical protein n=1 Tax=Prosthecobacter sp. TaxID=1965333 RepID=UPI0038FF95F2